MNNPQEKPTRTSLTGGGTYRSKFIYTPILSVAVILIYISMITSLEGENEAMAFGTLIALAMLFVVSRAGYRLHIITYDHQFVYVKRFLSEKVFPLNTVTDVTYNRAAKDHTYYLQIETADRQREFLFTSKDPTYTISGTPDDPESVKEFLMLVAGARKGSVDN